MAWVKGRMESPTQGLPSKGPSFRGGRAIGVGLPYGTRKKAL